MYQWSSGRRQQTVNLPSESPSQVRTLSDTIKGKPDIAIRLSGKVRNFHCKLVYGLHTGC